MPEPSELKTSESVVLHVLLRSRPSDETPNIGGHSIVITGAPNEALWGDRLQAGMVEGVVWTTESRVSDVLSDVRRDPRVVDACSNQSDRLSTRRLPAVKPV